MSGRLWLLAALVLSGCGGGGSSAAPSAAPAPGPVPGASSAASSYITAIVTLMHDNSINRLKIDWTSFQNQVYQRAANAQAVVDTYPAISLALGLLNDHHSFFVPPAGVTATVQNPSARTCPASIATTPAVPGDIGYVKIGSCCNTGQETAFADAIQQQIRAADRSDLQGWIVDVRGNTGGNMWPMIAGVGPVLGEGTLGFFVPPVGTSTAWQYQNGASIAGGSAIARTTTVYTLLKLSPRVAVLTDGRAASSGEAVVVAFRARPGARSFGTATCGLSTANGTFPMSDGGTLYLNTSVMADRTLTVYGDVIVPDETISGDVEVVTRAIGWLRSS